MNDSGRLIIATAMVIALGGTAAQARLSSACRRAAAQGGPCGCVASEVIFGRSQGQLWAVSAWLKFPRSEPGPGKAAIWPGRHVEAIVRANGDGTITTTGPYGVRRVRLASVVVVDPHGSGRHSGDVD